MATAPNATPGSPPHAQETPTTLDRLKQQVSRRLLKSLQPQPRQFCLITGAPRSGTTALYEWLSSHSKIIAATESRILVAAHAFVEQMTRFKRLDRYGEGITVRLRNLIFDHYADDTTMRGRNVVIDKEPLEPIAFPDKRYGAFLESMRIVFPEVRFIFMVRDPYATVWSMRQRKWGYSLANEEPRAFSVEEHTQNWCECVDLVLEYAQDPRSYVCSFERLVNEPEAESQRICNFFDLPPGQPFQTRDVKNVGFSDEEREQIREMTRSRVEALQERGLWSPAA